MYGYGGAGKQKKSTGYNITVIRNVYCRRTLYLGTTAFTAPPRDRIVLLRTVFPTHLHIVHGRRRQPWLYNCFWLYYTCAITFTPKSYFNVVRKRNRRTVVYIIHYLFEFQRGMKIRRYHLGTRALIHLLQSRNLLLHYLILYYIYISIRFQYFPVC